MNTWGVLQYYEELQTATGAAAKADALLKLYDQKTRKLTVKMPLVMFGFGPVPLWWFPWIWAILSPTTI